MATFDNEHRLTKIETTASGNTVFEELYEYNDDKLPVKVTSKSYDYYVISIHGSIMDYRDNILVKAGSSYTAGFAKDHAPSASKPANRRFISISQPSSTVTAIFSASK